MKTSTLKADPKQVAQEKQAVAPAPVKERTRVRRRRQAGQKVMIGGQFDSQVRRTLTLISLEPENEGRSLQDMLGEAINDFCVKYGHAAPYELDPVEGEE